MRQYSATVQLNWPDVGGRALTDMEFANLVTTMPPLPPVGAPPLALTSSVCNTESTIDEGWGVADGRGRVIYRFTRNPGTALISVYVESHTSAADQEARLLCMQFHSSLLTVNHPTADTLIRSPFGGSDSWVAIKKVDLDGAHAKVAWDRFPAEMKIGVPVGTPSFGLVHFLSGHAATLNTFLKSEAGKAAVFRDGQSDRHLVNTNGLHAIITDSSAANGLRSILHVRDNKFVLIARNNRKLVVDRHATPIHTLTTLYGANDHHEDKEAIEVWRRP